LNDISILWIGFIIAIINLFAILGNPAMASMWIKWKDPSKITMKEALFTYLFLVLPIIILVCVGIYISKR
jgi:formate hydrogenlyase subunit 3/multisubunit Na+/H+ antiporter MnhD subunit